MRKLQVVVCFHSRHLMICKHGLFTTNRWASVHEICLTQQCLQIVWHLLWKQTTPHSLHNNNLMFHGNLWPSSFDQPSILFVRWQEANKSHVGLEWDKTAKIGPVCYVKISREVSPTRVAVLSAFVANGWRWVEITCGNLLDQVPIKNNQHGHRQQRALLSDSDKMREDVLNSKKRQWYDRYKTVLWQLKDCFNFRFFFHLK